MLEVRKEVWRHVDQSSAGTRKAVAKRRQRRRMYCLHNVRLSFNVEHQVHSTDNLATFADQSGSPSNPDMRVSRKRAKLAPHNLIAVSDDGN